MATDTLTQILNWVIPLAIIGWLIYLVRIPLGNFFGWIRDLFGIGVHKIKEANVPQPFSTDGNIVYR